VYHFEDSGGIVANRAVSVRSRGIPEQVSMKRRLNMVEFVVLVLVIGIIGWAIMMED
jgi:hypothetical protein